MAVGPSRLRQQRASEADRELLGADNAGIPDLEKLDAELGEFAEQIKSSHPGGGEQWQALVRQTAPMWLEYEGLGPEQLRAIQTPALVLVGDRDELISLELAVSLFRDLPDAELAICPVGGSRGADAGARMRLRQSDPRLCAVGTPRPEPSNERSPSCSRIPKLQRLRGERYVKAAQSSTADSRAEHFGGIGLLCCISPVIAPRSLPAARRHAGQLHDPQLSGGRHRQGCR